MAHTFADTLTDTLARALFRRFAALFGLGFAVVNLALALPALLAVKTQAPHLPVGDLLRIVPDAWVAALPLTALAVAAFAAGAVVHGAARSRHLLAAALAGRPPWRLFWPLLLAAALAVPVLAAAIAHAVPEASYRLRFPVASAEAGVAELLGGAAAAGIWHEDLFVCGTAAGGGELHDAALAVQHGDVAAAAVGTRLSVRPLAPAALELSLAGGRLVRQRAGELQLNLGFGALQLSVSADDLLRPPKTALRSLAYYTNGELPCCGEQVRLLQRHGFEVTPEELRRAGATDVVVALRLAAALHPFLAVAVLVLLLARAAPAPAHRVALAAASILLGQVVQVLLEGRAHKVGDLPGPWIALAPAMATLAAAWAAAARRPR